MYGPFFWCSVVKGGGSTSSRQIIKMSGTRRPPHKLTDEAEKKAFWDNIQREKEKNVNVAEKQKAAQQAAKEDFWDNVAFETTKNRNLSENIAEDEKDVKDKFWDNIKRETDKNPKPPLHAIDKRHLVRMAIPDSSPATVSANASKEASWEKSDREKARNFPPEQTNKPRPSSSSSASKQQSSVSLPQLKNPSSSPAKGSGGGGGGGSGTTLDANAPPWSSAVWKHEN